MRIALLMMLMAGLSGAYAAPAVQKPGESVLRLSCNSLSLNQGARGLFHGRSWGMSLELKIEKPAGWKLVWCEENKARVTMEDSAGNKATDIFCSYFNWNEDDVGSMNLSPHSWKPAAGAQWVRVKGEVPFVVSSQDAVSEPVTVKLVKGFSTPVMLKGAGLAGEDGKPVDVKATLKVKDYLDAGEKGKKRVALELSAGGKLGFRELELQTTKGQPVIAESRGMGSSVIFGSCSWSKTLEMDEVPEGEVRVMVRYAGEPWQVMAVVDSRAALSGFGDQESGRILPGENGKPGKPGNDPAGVAAGAVVVQSGSGKSPAVKAELDGFEIKGNTRWMANKVRQESPLNLVFKVRLETKGTAGFGGRSTLDEQSLEVTDSTGRALSPAVFDLGWLSPKTNNGVSRAVVVGKGPELASPGAEWVRVKGTLRVPMAGMKESPVYELPLVKGAEQHIPVPGMEETGENVGDVATAGDAPTCKLWLEKVDRKEDGEAGVEVALQVEGVPFDFDEFDLIDDKGKSLDAYSSGGSSSRGDSRCEWSRRFTVRKAAEMKKLRVKLKYKTEAEMAPVPVDMTVGLGGPVKEKVAGAENAGKGGR